MEIYITPLRRNSPKQKFSLPAYANFIDQLRLNQYQHFSISDEIKKQSKQIHLVWINLGLIIYIPKSSDPSYMHKPIDTTLPLEKQIDEKNRRHTAKLAAKFGEFEVYQIVTWKQGAKAALNELMNDAVKFLDAINETFKGTTRPDKEIKKSCMSADTIDIVRQLKFITIGILHKNDKMLPPIDMYQHILYRMSAEMICKGAGYRGIDEAIYTGASPKSMISIGSLELNNIPYNYVLRVKEFNPKEDVWLQTGGSIMLTSGPRESENVSQDVDAKPVVRPAAKKIVMALDDDSSEEDDEEANQ